MEFIQYVMLTVAPIRGWFLVTSVLLRGELVDERGARCAAPVDPASSSCQATTVRPSALRTAASTRCRSARPTSGLKAAASSRFSASS